MHTLRCGSRARCLLALSLSLAVLWAGSPLAAGAQARTFRAAETLRLSDLERVVGEAAPELSAIAGAVSVARADSRQARMYGNPSVDAAWSTIPVGRTNPVDLARPMRNVPGYELGVSYTFPLAKRAKRIMRADAVVRARGAELEYGIRERALALADVLGVLATASLRRDGIGELVEQGRRAAELAEARLRAQFGTPLDVDQMQIEVERTTQQLRRVESDVDEALAACASLAGTACETFPSSDAARAFLARWLGTPAAAAQPVEKRADLRALAAYAEVASVEAELARAERFPDLTVRVGYEHDRFLVSGNQRNSLNVGISLPLPSLDRGQSRTQAALASLNASVDERARRIAVAHARSAALRARSRKSQERCAQLGESALPKARAVLANLEFAAENRLIPLTQVIQARRVMSELFVEEAESCGDAFAAKLELIRETAAEGDVL